MQTSSINHDRLRALRGKRSREVIAHELRRRGHATDAKAIWRWERGKNQPSARVLPDYAEVLGAKSVDELYGTDDEEESESMPVPAGTLDDYLRLRVRQIVREERAAEEAETRP